MTEYEHVQLFFQIVDVAGGTTSNYMTLIFGMLVSSYLAAHRLDRLMAAIALIIYSLFSFGLCNEIFQVYSDFARLGLRISEFGTVPETSLGWFGPVAFGADGLRMIPYIMLVVTIGTYIGSIWFFFRARKANRTNDVGPETADPKSSGSHSPGQ